MFIKRERPIYYLELETNSAKSLTDLEWINAHD